MIQNSIKIAIRALLRRRLFTGINIIGLGLGMATAIFAFLWAQNEYSFDRYHRHGDQLYRINTDIQVSKDETWYWSSTPLPLLDVLKNEVPEVVRAALLFENPWRALPLKHNATMLHTKAYAHVSDDWFNLFDHRFLSGSAAGFQGKINNAILTRDFAEKLFGRLDVTGEVFQLDSTEIVVQAVIENHPANSGFTYELLLPLRAYLADPLSRNNNNWNNFNFTTFVELRPGADCAALGKKLSALANQYKEDNNLRLSVQPLAELHFDETRNGNTWRTGNRDATNTFALIGFIVLFLACVNYVSLTTAQAGTRTREVGIRKIVGANGTQVFQLLFAESVVTAFSALVAALVVVQATLPFFNRFADTRLKLDPANPAVWTVAGGTFLIALLLAGVYPAFFLAGFSPGSFLRGQNLFKIKNTVFRKSLVVTQFAIAVALVIGTLVLVQQQDFIRKKDLGYDRSHVFELTLPYSERRANNIQTLRQTLQATPGVIGTAVSNASILDIKNTHSGSVDWEGRPDDFVPTVSLMSVDADFRKLLNLHLADGRWFLPDNQMDENNVVLNAAAVRLFQLREPVVGQKFEIHGREGQVIGVVRDFHFQNLRQKIGPLVLVVTPGSNSNVIVKVAAGRVAGVLAVAREAWATHCPELPFEYQFMDDAFNKMYETEQRHAGLFQLLSGLATLISCLGLFGLTVLSTAQRTKEIGIRKILGASVASVVGLLSKDFLKLVLLALLIASPVAWYFMEKWLQNYAYRIDITWWMFALAGAAAVAVAFATVSVQSIRAALTNPVDSLRNE